MNQHRSDAPQHDRNDPPPGPSPAEDAVPRPSSADQAVDSNADFTDTGSGETDSADIAQNETNDADSAGTMDPARIRVGSPFAVDPIPPLPAKPFEPLHDVGPIRYTAMGAVAASVMVLGFAGAAAWWFPSGGALIAALGCVLSIFGLYSTYRITSAGLLAIHLCFFVLSYGRSLG